MVKRILIIVFFLIVAATSYFIYCNIFWENYFKEKWDNNDNYDFHPMSVFPDDSSLTRTNFQKYTWIREIIEPEHGQWINKTKLLFTSDSTMEVTVRSGYISNNYFYYPFFKEFISSGEPFSHTYRYNKNSMSFEGRPHAEDTVLIQLNKNTITIKYAFL